MNNHRQPGVDRNLQLLLEHVALDLAVGVVVVVVEADLAHGEDAIVREACANARVHLVVELRRLVGVDALGAPDSVGPAGELHDSVEIAR